MRRLPTALAFLAGCAYAQDRGSTPTKSWQDKAEYDLANAAATESDPSKKLVDLDKWAADFPETEYIDERLDVYLGAYQQLNQSSQAFDIAQKILQARPDDSRALSAIELPRQKVEPQYSEEARLAGLEGGVLVTGTITGDGAPQNLRVSRPLGLGLDEQAIAAAAQLRFDPGPSRPITVPIDFTLPSKQSRWHLLEVEFKTPAGASRPTFAAAGYPPGLGIGVAAYDEARILAAIGRAASATVSFDIDESGYPGNFQVVSASAEAWGPEAVTVVQGWRFHPGMKAGMPVSVPCTLRLVWGPQDFTAHAIAGQMSLTDPLPSEPQLGAKPLADSAIVFKTEPEYTDEARRAGIEGDLPIALLVDQEGKPVSMKVLTSGGALGMGLEENALEAVKQWRFQPELLNGHPATLALTVQVHFRLSGVKSSVSLTPPKGVIAAAKPPQ